MLKPEMKTDVVAQSAVGIAINASIGGVFVAIFVNLISVFGSAAIGLILGYLFQATFVEFLAMIGLGKFALWQVTTIATTTYMVIRPFFALVWG